MWSLPPWSLAPASHHDLRANYEWQVASAIALGEYVPFVYPYRSFGPYLLILYLLLPPPKSILLSTLIHYARYPVFVFIVYSSVLAIVECKSATPAVAYGIGLLNAWAILWSATLIIFNDARNDFCRIERREDVTHGEIDGRTASRKTGSSLDSSNGQALYRRAVCGSAVTNTAPQAHLNVTPQQDRSSPIPPDSTSSYYWQSLPQTFALRLSWTLDLVSNFRGLGWNFLISPVPLPPTPILSSLDHSTTSSPSASAAGIHRYSTRRTLLLSKLTTFTLRYLALDLLKVLLMHDPYFWGLLSNGDRPTPPPSYLPHLLTSSPSLTYTYRLLLSLTAIHVTLNAIFDLGPLFFAGLLGPSLLHLRAAPWLHPDMWGSFTTVLDRGLSGWWGLWWHQTFRFAFEAPSKFALRKLHWHPKSTKGKLLQLAVAFASSAFLHACGSYTSWPHSKPLTGSAAFFLAQGVGVAGQTEAAKVLVRLCGGRERIPRWVRRMGNLVFVAAWFYATGGLLMDDFARCGIWLLEPVPVSFVRGLGGEGWWCWSGVLPGWWWGERWWRSGIAF
ncbi:hypothetical protein MMC20_002740 [Loxospora ochrophaea]|nr:hypothetical protein [Loxospora ochrophaea]